MDPRVEQSREFGHNAFTLNPLIIEKREKLPLDEIGNMILVASSSSESSSPARVLVFCGGKALVSSREEANGRFSWHLAWQTCDVRLLSQLLEGAGSLEAQVGDPLAVFENTATHAAKPPALPATDLRYAVEVATDFPDSTTAALDLLPEAARMRLKSLCSELVYLGDKCGVCHFALDVSTMRLSGERSGGGNEQSLDVVSLFPAVEGTRLSFVDIRSIMLATDCGDEGEMGELSVAGQARALIEWNSRNRFCGKCGSLSAPIEAGCRRMCSSSACGNKMYPRIDPVCIMLVIDPGRDRALLGRQARFPPGMWSCLAGFIETGECLEEAVAREVREEAGVEIGQVAYHSSQPWPLGFANVSCQLMIGFFAVASTFEVVADKSELEDARWFSREEVSQILLGANYANDVDSARRKIHRSSDSLGSHRNTTRQSASASAVNEPDNQSEGKPQARKEQPGGDSASSKLFVPGPYAIAHSLIRTWVREGTSVLQRSSSRI